MVYSGIAALIKTTLMLERGFILPNYDFQKPNDKIPMSKWNLKVILSFGKFRNWIRSNSYRCQSASVHGRGQSALQASTTLDSGAPIPMPF
jgi:acyl transferase domain-containing protein